jgi:hypothetical protein
MLQNSANAKSLEKQNKKKIDQFHIRGNPSTLPSSPSFYSAPNLMLTVVVVLILAIWRKVASGAAYRTGPPVNRQY